MSHHILTFTYFGSLLLFLMDPSPVTADDGSDILFRAAKSGDVSLLQQVLPGSDPDLRDGDGRTALMIAAQEGHFEAARFLLWQGADANLTDADGNRAVGYLTPGDNGFAPLNLLLRTYAFVQKEAEAGEGPTQPHLVLVNDNFIDYRHPMLKKVYHVNEAERDGVKGEDDDGNGFVDDVYGWNSTEGKPVTPPLRSLLSDEENRAFVRDLLSRLEAEKQSSANPLAALLGLPTEDGSLSKLYDNPVVRDIGYAELVVEAELDFAPPQSQQDRRADKQPLKKRIPVSNAEELEIRERLSSLSVSGRSLGNNGLRVLLGDIIVEQGRILPKLLQDQSEDLKVMEVSDDSLILGWLDIETGELTGKTMQMAYDLTPSISYALHGQERLISADGDTQIAERRMGILHIGQERKKQQSQIAASDPAQRLPREVIEAGQ